MKFKNLLTGILLAGSALAYGQNPNDNYKKISELYGKKGERISYKDYSKIPWEQIDSNERKIFGLEDILEKPYILNKEAFGDSVFVEAEKLGYQKKDIQNLEAKKAIDLAINIVASRYEYDYLEKNLIIKDTFCLHHAHKNNDFYFFRKLGVCKDYSESFIEVFNLIKKENKNLVNINTTERTGKFGGDYSDKFGHSWNQLIILTKDSLFLSEIDLSSYDNNLIRELEQKHFLFKAEPKIKTLKHFGDHSLNYYLHKELLAQIPDSSDLKLDISPIGKYSSLFWKKNGIENRLKENYIEKVFFEENSLKLKEKGDSLLCEYKKVKREIEYLTSKINQRTKEHYEIKKDEALQEMIKSALSSDDPLILEDASNYFTEGSWENFNLKENSYYIYKDNKNKDKARKLRKELRKKGVPIGRRNTRRAFEEYKRCVINYY